MEETNEETMIKYMIEENFPELKTWASRFKQLIKFQNRLLR